MGIGKIFPSEIVRGTDLDTGVTMTQLTNYRGNSHHLYFTNNGWYDGGRRLVFGSDRDNRANMFSIELATGVITQLTDLPDIRPPKDYGLYGASVDPVRSRCYFFAGRDLMALDLDTLAIRTIYRVPDGFNPTIVSCTPGSKYVFTAICEDLSHRFHIDLHHGYVGFVEIMEMKPLCRLLMIDTEGAGETVLLEENAWIGHVNASPTSEKYLTYCHEGPWDRVDHRIWGMDTATRRTWKIHPCAPGEKVGHEYWLEDGIHLGYHGWKDGTAFFGCVTADNSSDRQTPFYGKNTGHTFSLNEKLIVGDGDRDGRYIRLWPLVDGKYGAPLALCSHFSSLKSQTDHPHPRFSDDGKQVLFTSDRVGYSNLYLADVPDLDRLPALEKYSSI